MKDDSCEMEAKLEDQSDNSKLLFFSLIKKGKIKSSAKLLKFELASFDRFLSFSWSHLVRLAAAIFVAISEIREIYLIKNYLN